MKPRPQENDQVIQIERNNEDQWAFLVPNKEIRNLCGYCLAWALKDRSVDLCAGQFTLDRTAMTAFDRIRQRSDVMRDVFALSARAINVKAGRKNARVWGPRDHDGATPLLDCAAVVEAIAQTQAAPVVQGLVDRHQDWPGLGIGPEHWGKTLRFERPDVYFGEDSPAFLEVTPRPPPGFEEEEIDGLCEDIRRRTNQIEEEARKARKARGEKALGLKALRRMMLGAFQKEPHERSRRDDFRTSCVAKAARARRAHLEFLRRHEEARREMLERKKERDFLFPPETYWWREYSDANCEPLRDREVYEVP